MGTGTGGGFPSADSGLSTSRGAAGSRVWWVAVSRGGGGGPAPPALQEQTLLVAKPDGTELSLSPQVWEGYNVVRCTRAMVGDSGAVGTIRGDLSVHIARNLVHASDSVETARREIGFWFQRHELLAWDSGDRDNIYGL
uniref:Nucleoside diphosphate kinase n=1 Tax=Ficedula albicollis TaxID=59894 RepID=A0A803VZB2_FICAL